MLMIINSLTKDSINLYIIGAKLMGLEISALFQTPFLNSGEAYPIFQDCGIHLSSMVLFKRRAKSLDKFVDAFH